MGAMHLSSSAGRKTSGACAGCSRIAAKIAITSSASRAGERPILRPMEEGAGRVARLDGDVVVPDLVIGRVDEDARMRVLDRERQSDEAAALHGEAVDV